MYHFLKIEDVKSLCNHVVENFATVLDTITYVKVTTSSVLKIVAYVKVANKSVLDTITYVKCH